MRRCMWGNSRQELGDSRRHEARVKVYAKEINGDKETPWMESPSLLYRI